MKFKCSHKKYISTHSCINHLDEMVSAQSICFDLSGEKLYAGLKNEIRIFDIDIPGEII